jgi:hypothetical protein
MQNNKPVLDDRTSEEIYQQTLELARTYCPELTIHDEAGYFDPDNPGLVLLKLFSKMTEMLIVQLNKIPDKQRLAFFNFAGIDLIPARPSEVPLTFYLTEGSSVATVVTSGTRVASSRDPDVVFETGQDLSVVAAKLTAVFSFNPWEDRYTDHSEFVSGSEDGFTIFGKNPNEKSVDHILYLSDDILFNIQRPVDIMIHLKGKDLKQDFFYTWYDGNENPVTNPKFFNVGAEELDISFHIEKLESTSINGIRSFWLSARPKNDMQIIKGIRLPGISHITVDIFTKHITPDIAFANITPVDLAIGFYPFEEEPKQKSAFYIGSNEAFSKENATIYLYFGFEDDRKFEVNTYPWEYWNGNEWELLELINTEKKPVDRVRFICPSIPPVEINGQLNRWIRVKNIYDYERKLETKGIDDIIHRLPEECEKYKKDISKIFNKMGVVVAIEYKIPDHLPPFIKSLTISYSYHEKEIKRIKTLNNFQFKDFQPGNKPIAYSNKMPALYLGFNKNIANMPLTLFFALKMKLFNETDNMIIHPDYKNQFDQEPDCLLTVKEPADLVYKYFNGVLWKDITVKDETDCFETGGMVSFIGPSDIKHTLEFERELYWIKVEINKGNLVSCPKLTGIFPNTVQAMNNITVEDEILGSGNGHGDLTLSFSKKPILEGEVIEVKEIRVLSKDEITSIVSKKQRDALKMQEGSGKIQEIWVRWHEIKDFALSGPQSRHYILDRANGRITFGDGIRGMIPQNQRNNIIAREYKSGGGKKGDVETGMITSLRTSVPNIDSVTNHIPSSGGYNQETLDHAVERGPYTIKSRNKAITKEDFEWLTYESSQYVARAKCIPDNERINVIIVPKYDSAAPLPDIGLLDMVEKYLKNRAFFLILNRIEVTGPDYKQINVDVKFKPLFTSGSTIVLDRIKKRLELYLHPLKGGHNQKGWEFGQDIYISKIAAVIEGIEGVDYVTEIIFTKDENEKIGEKTGVEHIRIKPNALPCCGNINVTIEG